MPAAGNGATATWPEILMESVAKCERNCERQLYVYGISASRCPMCHHRMKAYTDVCENCQYRYERARKCQMCNQRMRAMWCYDCDLYFCEQCHQKPHLLTLGSAEPPRHSCFAVEGTSGKRLVESTWSNDFLDMVKGAYKTRISERQAEGDKKATTATSQEKNEVEDTQVSVTEQQLLHADTNAAPIEIDPAPSANDSSEPMHIAKFLSAANGNSTDAEPRPGSRKRKLPESEKVANPTITPQTAAVHRQQQPQSAPAQQHPRSENANLSKEVVSDGLSLYERVRQMHDEQLRNRQQQQQPHPQLKREEITSHQMVEQILRDQESKAQQQFQSQRPDKTHPHPVKVGLSAESIPGHRSIGADPSVLVSNVPPIPQSTQRPSVPVPSSPSPQVQHPLQSTAPSERVTGTPLGDSDILATLAEQIEPPPQTVIDLSTDSTETQQQAGTGGGDYASVFDSTSTMEDPLKIAVVEDYDKINEYVLKLESQLVKLKNAVRRVSFQNVTLAAQLNERIGVYRTELDKAFERRFQALARVIVFSPDVRKFAHKVEKSSLTDVPHVLTACHKKCAQLSTSIQTHRQKLRTLRGAIDAVIASGDVAQLQQLQQLGNNIAETEQQIQNDNTERDNQFIFMIQFSHKLRQMIRNQVNVATKNDLQQ